MQILLYGKKNLINLYNNHNKLIELYNNVNKMIYRNKFIYIYY